MTIHPYFKVSEGKIDAFKQLCERFVAATATEPKCLYYGFSFRGDDVFCREGYQDAEATLSHIDNVGALLKEAMQISELTRFEIHGPEEELSKLREPLAGLNAAYFVLHYGFRR